MEKNITTTIYGNRIQDAMAFGLTVTPEANTTINEVLTNSSVVPFQPTPLTLGMEVFDPYNPAVDTTKLKLGYYCIGNKGHTSAIDPDTHVPYMAALQHSANDSGLYGMIPFVVVPVSSDLSPSQRSNYRLRKTMMIGGVLHAAYYAKVFAPSTTEPDLVLQTTVDGVTTSTPFVPNINNLVPTPPALDSSSSGTYYSTTAPASIEFTLDDYNNLRNACNIIYGNPGLAVVSEITLCYGVDHQVQQKYPNSGTQTPAAVSYTAYEVVGLQAAVHITEYNPAAFTDNFDIGITEPVYGIPLSG